MINPITPSLPKIRTQIPGPKSKSLAKKIQLVEAAGISTIAKGQDPIFWDKSINANVEDVDGNIYIDCTSGFGVSAVGHTNPSVRKAIQRQSQKMIHGVGDIFPNSTRAELLERIVKLVGRSKNPQAILVNSGSEAVEVAIQTATLYTGKPGIIAFQGGFHGQTIGALSVSSQKAFRDPFDKLIAKNTIFAPYPDPFHTILNEGESDASNYSLNFIESILKNPNSGIPPIGSIIIEPIQNLNGYIVPPDNFLVALQEICNKNNILFIADEIFTGFGRTGSWLAVDHIGVKPDITCVGKAMTGGMPIAACVADSRIFASWETSGFMSLHSSTFFANPVCCASAIAAIDELQSKDLINHSQSIGNFLLEKLFDMKDRYEFIGDIRGRGLLIGIELVDSSNNPNGEAARFIVESALQRGVIIITTRYPFGNVIALCPPLVISQEQIEFVLKVLNECFAKLNLTLQAKGM